jgi:hypothetical protein
MVHTRWLVELGRLVTAVHGGAASWVVAGRPFPAKRWSREGCSSTGEPRRVRYAQGKERRWGRRGGAHEAEISDELGHAPASNACRRRPYHGKLVRARAARGRGRAQRKIEAPVVHCGGRNGQRWRACVRAMAEKSHLACSAAAVERERKNWREWGGRARRWAS